MTIKNPVFQKALKFTLQWEGGFANDPDDPGGMTYKGISRNNWPQWEGWEIIDKEGVPHGRSKLDGMVERFYFDNFWGPLYASEMPVQLAVVSFDTAVNVGVSRAKGWIGKVSTPVVYGILFQRIGHYMRIANKNPKLRKYIRGWLNRVTALEQYANSEELFKE